MVRKVRDSREWRKVYWMSLSLTSCDGDYMYIDINSVTRRCKKNRERERREREREREREGEGGRDREIYIERERERERERESGGREDRLTKQIV